MSDENNIEYRTYKLETFKAISGILISISIFVAGALISYVNKKADNQRLDQDKRIAQDKADQQSVVDKQKTEMEMMTNLLKGFSSDKVHERVITVKYVESLIENGQVSRSFLSIIDLAKKDSNSEVAAAGNSASQSIVKKVDTNPTSDTAKQLVLLEKQSNIQTLTTLKFRPQIYLHIYDEDQRNNAKRVSNFLESERNFLVPGIERVNNVPNTTQIRYTHQVDQNGAEELVKYLDERDIEPIEIIYMKGFEDSTKIKAGTFEIWFSKDAFNKFN